MGDTINLYLSQEGIKAEEFLQGKGVRTGHAAVQGRQSSGHLLHASPGQAVHGGRFSRFLIKPL